MQTLDFNILYVADVAASTAFYRDLLDRPPAESSPTFAMFTFGNRVMLGLWGLDGVKPPAAVGAGGVAATAAGASLLLPVVLGGAAGVGIASAVIRHQREGRLKDDVSVCMSSKGHIVSDWTLARR